MSLIPQPEIVFISYNNYNYLMGEGEIFSLYDNNDGKLKDVDVPIPTSVINTCNQYVLQVNAGPTSAQDWSVWVSAYIMRP
jgi:hypothetical protein